MTPQVVLGAMLSHLADEIAVGKFGDVSEVVVFVKGQESKAIVTYPMEATETTADKLRFALAWLEQDEPETRVH